MTLTIREPERLSLAVDRIHDRWFDVEAIAYDAGTRVLSIPFWSRPTNRAPASRSAQPFDSLLAIHETDQPRVEDTEHIGTYTFNELDYSNGQVVITAEPNLRISSRVTGLHVEFGPDAIDQLAAKLAKYPAAEVSRAESSISIRPPGDSGFPVDVHADAGHYTVFFDRGWHEEFDTEQDVLNCVGFGLSSSCRLAVTWPWHERRITVPSNAGAGRVVIDKYSSSFAVG